MRRLIGLTSIATLVLATGAGAATLNKCIDARGKVTYSNLPCLNAREARAVEIDPAPLPDPVRSPPPRAEARPTPATPATPAAPKAATIRLETRRTSASPPSSAKPAPRFSARQCDTLTNKLGSVFDKMDQARRKGYTQKQMDAWNQEVKDLERKKQQSGCF